ncbi:MAG: type II secretion system F family protein [Candidatus Altiarchaeota archaeon]
MRNVPLMIIPLENAITLTRGWRGFTSKLVKLYPGIRVDLAETNLEVEADEYVAASILCSIVTGALTAILISAVLVMLKADTQRTVSLSVITGSLIAVLFALVLLSYPRILAGEKAELMERDLIYALKDMLLEVSSGASIYSALSGVAESGYGEVSKEFSKVIGKVNVGVPVEEALRDLAVKTKSEHLKNSVWQIVNSMRSGSSVEGVLRELVKDMTQDRKNKIRNYAQELNLMVLIYMLFAVVIPTIATTLVIVLGPFMGVDLGPRVFYMILPVCFSIQLALMEIIKSRRPVVYI